MSIDLPIAQDWGYLLLRLGFVALLYVFIWQVMRVTLRDLATSASRPAAKATAGRGALVVVDPAESGVALGTSFPLRARNTLGRHPDSSIQIDEPFLSSHHAEILVKNGRWSVRDLGSTNGTYIHGDPVLGTTDIEPGDVVQFGRIKLQLVR